MELKACPFCGGIVRIVVCDDEGNTPKEAGYEKNPWSGLGYMLAHERKDGIGDCPIATFEDETLGALIYDTRKEAAAAWNRRHVPAIPEPFAPTPIDPVVQHHPCNTCVRNPDTCGGCERLKRYEAARKDDGHESD